ncbi:hypothetical protein G7Z17_g3669 [Cylindrodendrum hubeiense]|uniref:F-box domain-containing protein n=1 Tax=Cylindrodendrum hubeiense TaxID=595255 RepID=A0A9P5LAL3_9HYPO|nr:hypothetical protein G7Z17_g3669 [Cylindrodendrum hubeiense]
MASPARSLPPGAGQIDLFSLPAELRDAIASHLPNRDIKSLRLTCTLFGNSVLLRINRVFLSVDPVDVRVFRAIADNDTYRRGVVELIWDDARLDMPPEPPRAYRCKHMMQHIEPFWQNWYAEVCERNRKEAEYRKSSDVDRPDLAERARWMAAQPPAEVLWAHYKELVEQQLKVSKSSDDAFALQYGLSRFPSLRKITLTPATHGVQFTPLYQTPMIRALPYGFNYPIPRGWPAKEAIERVTIPLWRSGSEKDEFDKNRWRGFRIITWMLAREKHNISDFVVDVSLLNTGLNAHMFDQSCDDYNDFVTMLLKPGFRRIDLALLVGGQHHEGWPAFRNGQLRLALGVAADLEHVSLRTNVPYEVDCEDWAKNDDEHFIPLRTIFSIDKWPKLQHFGLSGFVVRQADLISLLASLPPTVRSVELSFLHFQKDHGTNRDFLTAMRNTLDWRERPVSERPKVVMGWHMDGLVPKDGRAVWVDDEVNDFIYNNGDNPFSQVAPFRVSTGSGTKRDFFEPAYERPNAQVIDLMRMGIVQKSRWVLPADDPAWLIP